MSGPGIDVAKLKARLMEQRDALRDVADSTKEAAQPVEEDIEEEVGMPSQVPAPATGLESVSGGPACPADPLVAHSLCRCAGLWWCEVFQW